MISLKSSLRFVGGYYKRENGLMEGASMTADDDRSDIRMIAIDLLDEIIAEARDAWNGINERAHLDAQGTALEMFGEGHDPKMLARALFIAIADHLA